MTVIPITSADDFDFFEDTHTYLEGDKVRMSVTQALSRVGLIDYSMVPPSILDAARDRGVNVHACTEELDRFGCVDPTWIPPSHQGYVDAWQLFRTQSRFYCRGIEERRIAHCGGVRFGMTYDRWGWIGSARVLIDIKTPALVSPVAGLQLALYECGLTGLEVLGYYRRLVVQLRKDGTYRLHDFSDATDLSIGRAALQLTHGIGDLAAHNDAINIWADNHRLRRAA